MAHFAKLGKGNIVEQVVVVHNNVITDANGQEQEADTEVLEAEHKH